MLPDAFYGLAVDFLASLSLKFKRMPNRIRMPFLDPVERVQRIATYADQIP